jgi:hypothetical protein
MTIRTSDSRLVAMSIWLAFPLIGVWPTASHAAEVTLVPSLRATIEYNDNVTFARTQEIDDFVGTFTPGFDLNYKTALTDLSSSAQLDFLKYLDESSLDTVNQRYVVKGGYKVTERTKVTGDFSYIRDTTLDSELQETGVLVDRKDRKRFMGGGGVLYNLNEITEFGVKYDYADTSYQSKQFVDYDIHSMVVSLNRQLKSQRDLVTVEPYYWRTESDASNVDNYGLSFGWNHVFTELLSFTAFLGARYSQFDFKLTQSQFFVDPTTGLIYVTYEKVNQSDSDWGWVADVSCKYEGETFIVRGGYLRDLTYSSYGEPLERQRFYLTLNRSITERLGVALTGSLYFTQSRGAFNDEDSTYIELAPSLNYKLTERAVLSCAYQYAHDHDGQLSQDKDAQRNRIWLLLTMTFPKEW